MNYRVLLIYLGICHISFGKISYGSIIPQAKAIFVDRFCFISDIGEVQFEISLTGHDKDFGLYFFKVDTLIWRYNDVSSYTCDNRLKKLSNTDLTTSIIHTAYLSVCYSSNSMSKYACIKGSYYLKNTSRSCFLVGAINCGSNTNSSMFYKLTISNENVTNEMNRYLSFDQLHLPEMHLGFVLSYCCLLIIALYTTNRLHRINMLHTTFLLFLLVILLQTIGLSAKTLNWWLTVLYNQNYPVLNVISGALLIIAKVTFLVNLVSLAFGYTIVCGKLSVEICSIFGSFIIMYLLGCAVFGLLDNWAEANEDVYPEDATQVFGFLALRSGGWLFSTIASIHTASYYTNKVTFYALFIFILSVWFLILPWAVIITNHVVIFYNRTRILTGIELMLDFIPLFVYLLTFWQSSGGFVMNKMPNIMGFVVSVFLVLARMSDLLHICSYAVEKSVHQFIELVCVIHTSINFRIILQPVTASLLFPYHLSTNQIENVRFEDAVREEHARRQTLRVAPSNIL